MKSKPATKKAIAPKKAKVRAPKKPKMTNEEKIALFKTIKTYKQFEELKCGFRRRCFVVMGAENIPLIKEVIAKEKIECVLRKARKKLERLEKKALKLAKKAEKKADKPTKPADKKDKKAAKIAKKAAKQTAALNNIPDTDKSAEVK
ncbi:MAG: hypothetical protein ABIH76_04640 [Candidatus Bathyarchaeota archaeon]